MEAGYLPLMFFVPSLLRVWWHSRGEVEGADSDCQGAPWQTRQGVQPHQPGAQPAGQETEEGKEVQELS